MAHFRLYWQSMVKQDLKHRSCHLYLYLLLFILHHGYIKISHMNTITKQRDSNMELLRIIAMFLVMLFHIDFISLNGTNHITPEFTPLKSFIRIFLANSTFTCVDVFVLLSGWYGMKFKYSKLGELIFQVLFFSIISYVVFAFFGITNYKLLLHVFFLDAYWFVPTYLVLYISSPILNSFINNYSQ